LLVIEGVIKKASVLRLKQTIVLLVCIFFIPCGCNNSDDEHAYPRRPKKSPYYYNDEFVTVILNSLPENVSLENYAATLFHRWKIGRNTNGKGVLLLFVSDTESLKIEVGYELEGVFTDAFCSSFQSTIKSYYAGRYFGDVFCWLVESMERRILWKQNDEDTEPMQAAIGSPAVLKSADIFLSGGGGIIDEYYYEKNAKLTFINEIPSEKVHEFDTDKDIDIVLERYFKSLEGGINYPFLGILTEGSQLKRLEYPESEHFYKSRWEDCQAAFPYQIEFQGDLAAVRFVYNQSFPVFFRRDGNGHWKIDETRAWVSSWQDFFANKSGPLHKDHPWMFAFLEHNQKKSLCNVPSLLPASTSVRDEIEKHKRKIEREPNNSSNYFELADILYWDCLWIAAAVDLTEKGLELEPQNVPYRWLAIFMRYRFPDPDPNINHLEKLLEIDPDDYDALEYYSRHHWYYIMDFRKSVKILQKLKTVEKESTNDTFKYRWLLNSYKKNYWNQINVDRNILYRCLHYLYIFHFYGLFIFVIMTVIIIGLIITGCMRKKAQKNTLVIQS
jgi:tetratricopeptide (TPR) repeat protein